MSITLAIREAAREQWERLLAFYPEILSGSHESQREAIERDPEALSYPLAEALDYWRSCCDGNALPCRSALDPSRIPSILSAIMLIDVRHDPLDFGYRLVGTRVAERAGIDPTGLRLVDLRDQGPSSVLWRLFALVARELAPAVAEVDCLTRLTTIHSARVLAMPLSSDRCRTNMLFCAVDFLPARH
jgi:hypothetical protein